MVDGLTCAELLVCTGQCVRHGDSVMESCPLHGDQTPIDHSLRQQHPEPYSGYLVKMPIG